jgi:hypothetical protein
VASVGCNSLSKTPGTGGSSASAIDTTALTATKPDAEKGDERRGHTPHPDTLGGPYGHGKDGTNNPSDPTLAAPVLLTTRGLPDSLLAAYLNALNFDRARDNGELALVACKSGDSTCAAKVYIQPEIGMKHRGYNDIPATGVVVARIINYSVVDTEATYGIPPLSRAYWYVYPEAGIKRSRLFVRTPTGAAKIRFLRTDTIPYSECLHANTGGPATAKFRKCVDTQTFSSTGDRVLWRKNNPFVRPASFTSRVPLNPDAEPLQATELWVKCAQGCCVSGAAQ